MSNAPCRVAVRRLSLIGRWALVACLLSACHWPWENNDYYTGQWTGVMTSPAGEDHAAGLDLVHSNPFLGNATLRGVLKIGGVPDSIMVDGSDPDWWGFGLVGESDCADMSGRVQYGDLDNLDGRIRIEWLGCERQGVEEWWMWMEREW